MFTFITESTFMIFPDHLQAANADCAHLSFGSFESGAFSQFSVQLSSKVRKGSLEDNEVHIHQVKAFSCSFPIQNMRCTSSDEIDCRNQDYNDNDALNS
jgi:hypothetical protein